jgi:hypothetical protein
MQLDNSMELKELKEQLAISHSQLAKERGTLVSQGKLEKRVKDDFQRSNGDILSHSPLALH